MVKKRCLFCDEIVPIESIGEYDRYIGCDCSPDGVYSLLRDSYEDIRALPYHKKHQLFPIMSGYIRELTDCGETVALSIDDLETVANSPRIPLTIEEKGSRLLQYLYRHSDGPGEPVVIQPLSHRFNLTYSPNLQELVYIIEKLREEQSIVRESVTFKLTDKGWSEAAARAGGRKLKACSVLLPDYADGTVWTEIVLPRIEQCGYFPQLCNPAALQSREQDMIEAIADSKLVIADVTIPSPEVYFAAGLALGLHIPVIWTVESNAAGLSALPSPSIRPIAWDTAEGLASLLQQRLA
ncbi:hypothetical protein IDH41_11695 [Paenibacillus sp. IB182493]|uniref:Uncharacterized protein n=2 Tax=Paenibacillus arenilitoris TaxID=2772299 RepID=A0A927CN73_9BACL|nr:hypothetical protein [Paenibacillus arenilitoris]